MCTFYCRTPWSSPLTSWRNTSGWATMWRWSPAGTRGTQASLSEWKRTSSSSSPTSPCTRCLCCLFIYRHWGQQSLNHCVCPTVVMWCDVIRNKGNHSDFLQTSKDKKKLYFTGLHLQAIGLEVVMAPWMQIRCRWTLQTIKKFSKYIRFWLRSWLICLCLCVCSCMDAVESVAQRLAALLRDSIWRRCWGAAWVGRAGPAGPADCWRHCAAGEGNVSGNSLFQGHTYRAAVFHN